MLFGSLKNPCPVENPPSNNLSKFIWQQAHDCGDIHIHDMDFLNMGTLT